MVDMGPRVYIDPAVDTNRRHAYQPLIPWGGGLGITRGIDHPTWPDRTRYVVTRYVKGINSMCTFRDGAEKTSTRTQS